MQPSNVLALVRMGEVLQALKKPGVRHCSSDSVMRTCPGFKSSHVSVALAQAGFAPTLLPP